MKKTPDEILKVWRAIDLLTGLCHLKLSHWEKEFLRNTRQIEEYAPSQINRLQVIFKRCTGRPLFDEWGFVTWGR